MRGVPTLVLLLCGGLLLGGCGLFGADGPTGGPDRLVDTPWQLTALRAPDGRAVPVDSLVGRPDTSAAYTLPFGNDGQLVGVADCNSYGGDYAARDNGTLLLKVSFVTEVFCGEGARESLYLDALSAADAYEVDDEGLRVRFDGEGGLRFKRPF